MPAGPVLPVRSVCSGRCVPAGRIVPILSAFLWAVVVPPVLAVVPELRAAEARVSGELRKWHRVTLSFDGPETSESAEPNPFRDYRLTATFRHPATGKVRVVPGFYAADGNAAESGADRGRVWQVRFAPDETGEWTWAAELRSGRDVAASPEPGAGTQVPLPGSQGTLTIAASDKRAPDARALGLLRPTGDRYLRWAETGAPFLKGGANSPENLLAYADFDGTRPTHRYRPHEADWRPGDPTWRDGRGKGLVGVANYLAERGMNSQYFLAMNVQGDGDDVWPWTGREVRDRYDCSKLDQWEIVFSHMNSRGLLLHLVFNEQEDDQLLDGGDLGPTRRIYYRELVARFGHHPALSWNLGEETTNTAARHRDQVAFLRALDPYGHPIVMHTFPGHYDRIYDSLLGLAGFTGPSLQLADVEHVHSETIKWIDRSKTRGVPWWVCLDEIGPARDGLVPDSLDPGHDVVRHRVLWGHLLAGGGGVEYYFGWGHPHHDRALEDYRTRENMWRQTRIALDFFRTHLPFAEMSHADGATRDPDDYCLADVGRVYAVYLPRGGTTEVDLGSSRETFTVDWFDPRTGGALVPSRPVAGPGWASLGPPPKDPGRDWVVLVRRKSVVDGEDPGRVVGFTLIDCDTHRPVPGFEPLTEGATLDLARLPKRLALRADTEPAQVGSVRFELDGQPVGTEDSTAPFALPRDVNGRYEPGKFVPGRRTLTAVPFAQGAGDGRRGAPRSVTFTVIGP